MSANRSKTSEIIFVKKMEKFQLHLNCVWFKKGIGNWKIQGEENNKRDIF